LRNISQIGKATLTRKPKSPILALNHHACVLRIITSATTNLHVQHVMQRNQQYPLIQTL